MLIVIGCLYFPPEEAFPWSRLTALLIFLFAALTDWLDGWLARRMGQVSDFGKFMDALCDKILTAKEHITHTAKAIIVVNVMDYR